MAAPVTATNLPSNPTAVSTISPLLVPRNQRGQRPSAGPASSKHTLASATSSNGLFKFISFEANLRQLGIEAFSTLVPKILVLGIVLRSIGPTLMRWLSQFPLFNQIVPSETVAKDTSKPEFNWASILDDAVVEFLELLLVHISSSLVAAVLAKGFAPRFGLKGSAWKLAGIREVDYKLSDADLKLRLERMGPKGKPLLKALEENPNWRELMPNIGRLKFLSSLIATIGAVAGMASTTAWRNIFISTTFPKAADPYQLMGLDHHFSPEEEKKQQEFILHRAWNYLKVVGTLLVTSVAAVLGMSLLRRGGRTGLLNDQQISKVVQSNDLGTRFGLGPMIMKLTYGPALLYYLLNARPLYNDQSLKTGNPEFWECLYRVSFVVLMAVFAKPFLKMGLARGLTARKYPEIGKKILIPKERAREFNSFGDWDRLSPEYIQHHLPEFQRMPEARQKQLLKDIDFITDKGIYIATLAIGILVNIFNYIRSYKMNVASNDRLAKGKKGADDSEDQPDSTAASGQGAPILQFQSRSLTNNPQPSKLAA